MQMVFKETEKNVFKIECNVFVKRRGRFDEKLARAYNMMSQFTALQQFNFCLKLESVIYCNQNRIFLKITFRNLVNYNIVINIFNYKLVNIMQVKNTSRMVLILEVGDIFLSTFCLTFFNALNFRISIKNIFKFIFLTNVY